MNLMQLELGNLRPAPTGATLQQPSVAAAPTQAAHNIGSWSKADGLEVSWQVVE